MSGSTENIAASQGPEAAAPAPIKYATWTKDCAVITGGFDGPIIAHGPAFGSNLVSSRLVSSNAKHTNPWIGLYLSFPLGQGQRDKEAAGFGFRH